MATSSDHLNKEIPIPRQRLRDIALLTAVLAAAATALIFGLRYQAAELGRETDRWAARLDTATLAGARNISTAVEAQSAALLELADNASLRLYLWTLLNRDDVSRAEGDNAGREIPAAEFDYLRSLLAANTDSGTRAKARVMTQGGAFRTLALLDAQLSTVLTTPGAATTEQALQIARQATNTRTRQLVLARNPDGNATLYMAVIVEPPPGAAGKQAIGGVLVAASDAAELLQPLVKSLPGYFDTDANLLISSSDDLVVVLTGNEPLIGVDKTITLGFSLSESAANADVLQSAQKVSGTGWKLVRRVDAERALSALQQRIWANFVAMGLSVVLLATLFWAWRERSIRLQEKKNYLPMVMGNQFSQRPVTHEEHMLNKLVASLVDVIDLHDPYSAFHSARLAELCRAVGMHMGLDKESLSNLVTAAMLANVGKISLPRELLTKREELSETDAELLHTHVEEGVEILRKLDFDDPVLAAIAEKQEQLDGGGYPHGLAEDRISLLGRILSVTNAYIALVSPRAYREAMTSDAALATLRSELGSVYDREVFQALEKVVESGEGLSDWEFPQSA